ncbi:hypothetical protein [Paracidovorax cattleyae]|uniref:hypothetical protein n=1 Tax=Paracidovorax cattleyae TaxID=80868 RepID=UPI00115F9494|nr:hypothetical protein [Paracidovorax cattleyae]
MAGSDLNQETRNVRKTIWFGLPLSMAFLILCYLIGIPEIFQSITDLREGSPSVRISVAALSLVIFIPLILIMMPLSILKAIPIRRGVDFLVKLLNFGVFAAAAFMVIGMPLLTLVQYNYMPKLGYSKCNELRGHPTIWFNDWVKNPKWCVPGKDRAWVLEQARSDSRNQ